MKKTIIALILVLTAFLTLSPVHAEGGGTGKPGDEVPDELLEDFAKPPSEAPKGETANPAEANREHSPTEPARDASSIGEREASSPVPPPGATPAEKIFDQSLPSVDAEGEIRLKELKANPKHPNSAEALFPTYIYSLGGNDYEFLFYKADMNDRANYIDLKLADNNIGHLNYLPRLVEQSKREDPGAEVLAAINGGLFNMGKGRQPTTSVIEDGTLKYSYYKGAIAYFNGDNEMFIERDDFEIFFAVNGLWEAPYGFSTIFVNQINYDPDGVGILSSDYDGERFDKDMIAVELKDKTAIRLHNRVPKKIEKGNLLIVSEKNPALRRIKVGDRIDYVTRAHRRGVPDKKFSTRSVRTGIGSGPAIIEGGKITADPHKDGLADLSVRGNRPRSMVGMTKDKKLYFVVAKSMDVGTLAKLGLKLGMDVAINLDGGGSSELIVGDRQVYKQKTKRAIANALLIKRHKEVPIRIQINEKERFYDTNPFLYEGRTMVPLRGILEDLECKVSWDASAEQVVFERYGKRFSVKKDSKTIYGKDKNFEMDVPLLVKDGRSNISARFLSEVLGGEVSWDGDKREVKIKIASANELFRNGKDALADGREESAKQCFENALKVDPKHISSMDSLAKISEMRSLIDDAMKGYLKILDLDAKYIPALENMGRIYKERKLFKESIAMYLRLVETDEQNLEGLKNLARLYQDTKDNKNAIKYFEKAYEIDKKSYLAFSLINLYQKELEKNGKDFELLKKTARTHEDVLELKEALSYYERAYAVKKNDLFVLKRLGTLNSPIDRKKAIRYYEEAYQIDQKDEDLIIHLANFYEEEGNTEKAIKYLKDASTLRPNQANLLIKLASVYEKKGDYEKAAEHYEKAFALNEKDTASAKRLAEIYGDTGKPAEAIRYYKKVYELSGDETSYLKALNLSLEFKDYDGAIRSFEALKPKTWKEGNVHYLIAEIYLEKQMAEEGFQADSSGLFELEKYNNEKAYRNFERYLQSQTGSSGTDSERRKKAERYLEKYAERQGQADFETEPAPAE